MRHCLEASVLSLGRLLQHDDARRARAIFRSSWSFETLRELSVPRDALLGYFQPIHICKYSSPNVASVHYGVVCESVSLSPTLLKMLNLRAWFLIENRIQHKTNHSDHVYDFGVKVCEMSIPNLSANSNVKWLL